MNSLSGINNFKKLYKVLVSEMPTNCKISKKLKLLLLNAPCNGFGDLIFVKKLADHLRKTFKISVTIATTEPNKLLMLGEDKRYLKKLASENAPTSSVRPCRVFHDLRMYDIAGKKKLNTNQYDLFFVAPLSFDYDPKISDIKPLVPHATRFNTFFFSEYNDTLRKDFDFHTGVGKGRDGILLTTPKIEPETKINRLVGRSRYGPFALIYIADIERAMSCVKGFLELVSKKYSHNRRFQIIVPPFLYMYLLDSTLPTTLLGEYWGNIKFIGSDRASMEFKGKGSSSLTIRGDILPVKNHVMLGLIHGSVKDILLTGDQSITDALSCCHHKNIFYQIAPWKTDFGKEMAKALPHKFLKSSTTSCGNLSAINYKSSYGGFIRKHDFFKNAHKHLKSILCMATANLDKRSDVHKFISIVNQSKTLAQVKKKLKDKSHKRSRKPSRKPSRKRSRKRSRK